MNFRHKYINRIRSRCFKLPFIWSLKVDYLIHRTKIKHQLPASLIVSLTSYPARFNTLAKTLKCLLNQSIIPDKVILWIATEDKEKLTAEILTLKNLDIKFCKDLKSYKKMIPTLFEFKDCFIVTADDDLYCNYNWLEKLVEQYNGNNNEVICHRAHKIILDENGIPVPYLKWEHPKIETKASELIFPTCGAGALFPPGIFNEQVTNSDLFSELCPTSDDIWFWWMVRLNGGLFRKVGPYYRTLNTSKYNQIGLWFENLNLGGNDKQMQSMINKFGTDVFK